MHTPIPAEKYKEILDAIPICTVDVLFFNKDLSKTLLFRRTNEPLKGVYFSVGGRLLKNEKLEDCAVRQALREIGISVNKDMLTHGGTQEELNPNSAFHGISYHAIDTFYGYVLDDNEKISLDSQSDDAQWFSVSDDTLHPFLKTKIASLLKVYGKEL